MEIVKADSKPYTILADISKLTEDEWLEMRMQGIGGSEAGAVVGLNPFKSALHLYQDKLGISEKFEGNEATEFGKEMEDPIRKWFAKKYVKDTKIEIKVEKFPYMMKSIKYPWMIADVDGIMDHPEMGRGLIEIKTSSERRKKEWEDEAIPDEYYCQVQHYMAVTGLPYTMLVYLLGKKLAWKLVPRNDEFIQNLAETERKFWFENIQKQVPPPGDGSADATEALKFMYGKEEQGQMIELPEMEDDYDSYKELAKQIKELTMQQEAIKQKFMSNMKDAEVAFIGKHKATWKTVEKKGYFVEPKSYRMLRIY